MKREILRRTGTEVSKSTVKRHRKLAGLEECRVIQVPFIRAHNQEKRKEFTEMLKGTDDRFDDVIFTDETSVQVNYISFYWLLPASLMILTL